MQYSLISMYTVEVGRTGKAGGLRIASWIAIPFACLIKKRG